MKFSVGGGLSGSWLSTGTGNRDFLLLPLSVFRSPCPYSGPGLSLLAHALDSLVRVSRKVAGSAFIRAVARFAKERWLQTRSDLDPGLASRGLLQLAVFDGGPSAQVLRRRLRAEKPRLTPLRPCGFSPLGRFRDLFDYLFRPLFDLPSRYLCAIGVALWLE